MKSSTYAPPGFDAPIELDLSRNEGRAPRGLLESPLANATEPKTLSGYPDLSELESAIARRFGVPAERLLLTAGADDGLMRACLATLAPGSKALFNRPTFAMIPRYVALAGGDAIEVPWPAGPFPRQRFLSAAVPSTRLAFVVSPNNPTGAYASAEDLEAVARALPEALVILDAAYGEFADDDLTEIAASLSNVVILRTLSKAWGLAGLRVGFAIGEPGWIGRLRAAGNPFPISSTSAAIAIERLESGSEDVADYVQQVGTQRRRLEKGLADLGARPVVGGRGNFVLARVPNAERVRLAAASLGVALRTFPDEADLEDAIRITLPGDEEAFERLLATLETVLAPRALIFDMDGVLADVGRSYRAAIIATVASYGVRVKAQDIDTAKARGNANDDWKLTQDLLAEKGVDAPLAQVTERFEALYQGTADTPGLYLEETLAVPREDLLAWRSQYTLGIVTGRPRRDARAFLERFAIADLFDAVVCREDAPLKPNPVGVELALERLGTGSAWMLGDTRDDLEAARGAAVLPVGVVPPSSATADAARQTSPGAEAAPPSRPDGIPDDDSTAPFEIAQVLRSAGAAAVLEKTEDLNQLLP